MNQYLDAAGFWLADFHLLAAALLGALAGALCVIRQPARRLAVVRSMLAGLLALAIMCASPGWSLIHLMSAEAPTAPISAPAVASTPTSLPLLGNNLADQSPAQLQTLAPAKLGADAAIALPRRSISWPTRLVALQAIGSGVVVAWLVCGSVMAARVWRRAARASQELQSMLQQIVGARRAPTLLVSDEVETAVALGICRPTIILSRALVEGSGELAGVLAHEWAHIRNGDLWTLAGSRLCLVLAWPQPLVWLLRRWMRLDQETLADAAAVVVSGRVDYAEQLLGWAQRAADRGPRGQAPRLAGAVGLWEGPSQLKTRVATLLDEKFTLFRECSRRWRVGSACMALAGAGLLSLVTWQPEPAMRAAAAQPPEVAPGAARAQADDPTRQGLPPRGPIPEQAYPAEFVTEQPNAVRGRCVDETGAPLGGAKATLYRYTTIENGERTKPEAVAEEQTNPDGIYRFQNVIDVAKDFPGGLPDEKMPARPARILSVVVRAR